MADLPTVHMIVKNEDRWIWYAIASVINHCQSLFIYDTGSIDRTVDIIKSFNSPKINFEEKGTVTAKGMVSLRNEQIQKTKTDWFMLVDGDEVWPEKSIIETINLINNSRNEKVVGVVSRVRVCLGNINHYQDEKAGKYEIGGERGHLNIRFYRRSKNYKWQGLYPDEAYTDSLGFKLQDQKERLIFSNHYYWHMTHLKRSTKVKNPKLKYELGYKIDSKDIPEIFFQKKPPFVSSPWRGYNPAEYFLAMILTPLKKIRRLF